MEPMRRPPTAGELSALSDAFQRNPASGFVDLGEAFLALGRPQEAIEVGAQGLRSAPDSAAGRIMVARAFASLHQWKEAQAELLKVVKAHRNHIEGFRMLGEVLMRRQDYERAIPVLMHAQNLAPHDPGVVQLLRQAREGIALDPPPPIPRPIAPPNGGPAARPADPVYAQAMAPAHTPNHGFDEPRKPLTQSQSRPRGLGPNEKPQGPKDVRPRVMANQKQFGAAQASLRMSAAVGEGHLPALLSQGLVAIPNVKAQRIDYRIAPVKRFGRSLVQLLSILGVVVAICAAGAGGWYWLSERTKQAEAERREKLVAVSLTKGTQQELVEGTEEAKKSLAADPADAGAQSLYALNVALRGFLYGDLPDNEIREAVEKATKAAKDPKIGAHRVAVMAQIIGASLNLGADRKSLPQLVKELEALSTKDLLATWIAARGHLAMGNRSEARKALEKAHQSGDGLIWASIDLADFMLDEGDFEGAVAIYNKLLEKESKPELAYLGRGLARAEQGMLTDDASKDIEIGLYKLKGARIESKRSLALVAVYFTLNYYDDAAEELKKVKPIDDVRWLARMGLYHLRLGNVGEAEAMRKRIAETHPEVESDPLVRVLDAEIHWFHGRPGAAIERLDNAGDMRAHLVRGKAFFDRRMYKKAAEEFAAARESAPDDRWTRIWSEATTLILAEQADQRQKAIETLDGLVRDCNDNAARVPVGLAYLALGDYGEARRKLESATKDISEETPNSMMARTRVALAQALLFEGKVEDAAEQADLALKELPSFGGAQGVRCRTLARLEDSKAVDVCSELVKEGNPDADTLASYAVVLAGRDRDKAIETLRKAKEAGASEPELQWAIKAIDPKLFDALGVPKPR
jgi:tetratricopeptide (TPR) repeat protein